MICLYLKHYSGEKLAAITQTPDIIIINPAAGDLAAIKGYWTGGVWTFIALCHLLLSVGMITKLSVRLPLSVSASFSIFNILVQEIAS